MNDRERELFELLDPVLTTLEVGLVELALATAGRRTVVRLVIHSATGVSHGVCARVTRACAETIDSHEVLPESYVLEVSSPGTNRVLKDGREFEVFRERRVRIREDQDGSIVETVGRCAGTRGDDSVVLRSDDGEERILPWTSVKKARLVPEDSVPGRAGGKER